MENLDRMTKAEEILITPIIDVQMLFEIIEEETKIYYTSDSDVDTKRVEKRIFEARNLTKNYLELLN